MFLLTLECTYELFGFEVFHRLVQVKAHIEHTADVHRFGNAIWNLLGVFRYHHRPSKYYEIGKNFPNFENFCFETLHSDRDTCIVTQKTNLKIVKNVLKILAA